MLAFSFWWVYLKGQGESIKKNEFSKVVEMGPWIDEEHGYENWEFM